MSALPIVTAPADRTPRWKSTGATLVRFAVVASIAVAIRMRVDQQSAVEPEGTGAIKLTDVQCFIPAAAAFGRPSGGMQEILSREGEFLGYAMATLPAAAEVVGYRGPSNVLLILNDQSAVVAARLIGSEDTPEHIAAIHRDIEFSQQFQGWTHGQPQTFGHVDATTGATLTSLAIAEGIAVRLGGEKPSLRFPDDINRTDLGLVFDNPHALQIHSISLVEADVLSVDGTVVGRLIRTGPLTDSIAGYQGPSELIAAIRNDGTVSRVALRRTYDNQPYAGYLTDEPGFWQIFQDRTLPQLQQLDKNAEQIEGVSGATMTSVAVADTIVAAAHAYVERKSQTAISRQWQVARWGPHDCGTVAVLCVGILIGMTRLRGRRGIRIVWNVLLLLYFGLTTGNLISLAVIMGWAAGGIAWRLAPGLALVVFVGLLLPPTTQRNLYCSHLCPHGAAQQLLRRRWKTDRRLSAAWSKRLRWIPGLLLATATLATLFGRSWNLASWEPFNAYIWYVAGVSSLVLAVGSLLFSAAVPMAYCRYGCATGRLLEYVRRSSAASDFTVADGVTLSIAATAWGIVLRNG